MFFFLLVAGEWFGRWVRGQRFLKKKVNGGKEMEGRGKEWMDSGRKR